MGNLLQFPELPNRYPSNRPGLRKRGEFWRAIDLKGKPPKGHLPPSYGPRGRVQIAINQVWVEGHTQKLYMVLGLVKIRDTFYPHNVVFAAYKREHLQRQLAETTFRLTMKIWDVFESERKVLANKVGLVAEQDPEFPWKGDSVVGARALNFFGLDSDGYRID
ncbi:MAG: hypothetical protein WAV21_01195 [Minisyncoccia bacterium]